MNEGERKPVGTLAELETLDERDILHGYYAGLAGREEPGVEFNRSFWHGWENGMRDRNKLPPTAESMNLAHEYLENERRKRHERN